MKASLRAFSVFLLQIRRDSMLLFMLFAPLIAGAAFRFGVPALEALIVREWTHTPILEPYFVLFDALLAFLTPYLACTVASFVLLEERDDSLAAYYAVTPVRAQGYLASRLLYPAAFGFAFSFALLALFHLAPLGWGTMVLLAALSAAMSVAASLVVVSAAGNKVEGLAVVKLTGVSLLGLFAPFFLHGFAEHLFAVFPSYFLGKIALSRGVLSSLRYAALGFVCCAAWCALFYRSFARKLRR